MSSPEQELADLRAENRRLRVESNQREQEAHDLRTENEELRTKLAAVLQRIERMTKRLYGWSSERHHPDQQRIDLGLLDQAPSAAEPIADAAPATETASTAAGAAASPTHPGGRTTKGKSTSRPAGRHPGRHRLPEDTEVVIDDPIEVPDRERLDADGVPLPLLGYRVTDKWDYRIGTYIIRRIRRAIYGKPFSEAQDRIVAPMPGFLIPKGQMTDAALIHTVVEKFADHLPLYRQESRAARQGIRLSRSSLVNHVAAVATAIRPIYDVIVAQVRSAPYVHLDDSPVKYLDPGRGHAATGRIWVYRSAYETAFQFTTTREGRHPAAFLGDYQGFIVADAYSGHERLYGPGKATPIGCWAHVRRKFHEIIAQYPLAERLVGAIAGLYQIEEELRLVDDDDRRRARQARAVPLHREIHQRLLDAKATVLPSSDLGGAVAYALTRWPTLTPYADHGFLPIDNNPAENALRPWAVGRKNWLFFGSVGGGERAAVIATLIENCRIQGIDPYTYLLDAVAALHQGRTDYHAFTPRALALAADRATA